MSLYPLLAINFVGTLGFSIVLPFLVFLVERWGGNALVYGVMGATYSATQLVGAPILGRWSDRHGRRKILLLSQAGTLVSWLVFLAAMVLPVTTLAEVDVRVLGRFTLTVPLLLLFMARGVDGLTGGNVSVANAYLADITPEAERSANFGRMAVSANLGFIVGPALAGLLGATPWGELVPVLAAVAISLAATLLILLVLPESQPRAVASGVARRSVRKVFGQEQRECFEPRAPARLRMSEILAMPGIAVLLGIHFLVMLGFNFFYVSFPVHAATRLAWSVTDTGAFFAVMSLLMVVVQGPVLKRLSRTRADRELALHGSVILAAGFLLFRFEGDPLIYTGAALLALGNGLMWPSVLSLVSKAAGSVHQGSVQGFAGSLGAVASIAGLLIGGVLYEHLGGWIFGLAAIVIVGAAGMVVLTRD